MPQGYYDTMVSQICNRLNINFLVFSLSLGDLVAYKFKLLPDNSESLIFVVLIKCSLIIPALG